MDVPEAAVPADSFSSPPPSYAEATQSPEPSTPPPTYGEAGEVLQLSHVSNKTQCLLPVSASHIVLPM